MSRITALRGAGTALALAALLSGQTLSPSNPFAAPSSLPFEAPPFNKIKDADYEPAFDAGIAEEMKELEAIANNPAPATFDNTFVALEKSGRLLGRVTRAFNAVSEANTNPELQNVQRIEAPKLAALEDAKTLNPKLFARVEAIYRNRATLGLDAQSLHLVEQTYDQFKHAGANLPDDGKTRLKQINEQLSKLSNTFSQKLLAATSAAAYNTTDKAALAGLADGQLRAAALAAEARKQSGYTLPLQNTTQQPALTSLTIRKTRQSLFEDSWERAERGGDNDTRDTIAHMAKLRAEKGQLLGFPNFAAWKIEDQMAKTPDAALRFLNALVPAATRKANGEAKDIQALIDRQNGNFTLAP
jgi:peptidyl-dipeptidase Dcp